MPDFSVHTRQTPARHARRMSEASSEAAAIAYVEDFPHAEADDEMRVVVTDLQTGREQCYRIDLHTGEAQDCA